MAWMLRVLVACASAVHFVMHAHAVATKDLRPGHVEQKPSSHSLVGSPPDSKDLENKMLAAAQREAENSASAKANADNMANAAAVKAADLQKAAQASVQKILSSSKETMNKSIGNCKKSIKTATDKESSSLVDAKASVQAAIEALKLASTNAELITANRKAHSACEAAIKSANNSMDQLQSMLVDVRKEAQTVMSAAQTASEDMDKVGAKTKDDLESLASQVAEVGSTVSVKMQAKTDGNAIALQTSQAADDIRAVSRKFVDETHNAATSIRSSGEAAANLILQEASDAKSRGDIAATQLADTAKVAIQTLSNAKDSWTTSGTNALGTLIKAASPADIAEAPEGAPVPLVGSQDGAASRISLIVFMTVIVGIVAGALAKVTCFSKN